jgi:hypothetical protein
VSDAAAHDSPSERDADPVDIARKHLERRAAEERDTECAECGARNPPTRTTPGGTLAHDGCDRADALWQPVVRPYGSRSCLGAEDSDAVCRDLIGATVEVEELAALVRRQGELLRATADALKGPPPAGTLHSVHDLPEVAARLAATAAAAAAVRERLDRVLVDAIVAGEAFAELNPYAAGAIMGGVAHRSEVDDGR